MIAHVFEFTVYLFYLGLLLRLIRKRYHSALIVNYASLLTVTTGEVINAYITRVTVYSPQFLIWLPGGDIPLCIIPAGCILSLSVFGTLMKTLKVTPVTGSRRFIAGFVVLCVLALTMPIVEKLCLTIELWSWQRPSNFGIAWFIGVYRFYFVFVLIAVIPGWLNHDLHKVR